MFYYIIAFVMICLDQLTKWLIVKNMMLGDSYPVIDGFFYITSHRNSGAAWGILQGQMWFFYVITLVVIAGIVYYLQKHGQKDKLLGVALYFNAWRSDWKLYRPRFPSGSGRFCSFRLWELSLPNF